MTFSLAMPDGVLAGSSPTWHLSRLKKISDNDNDSNNNNIANV